MTHEKFGDILFMAFSSLIIALLIIAIIYTTRAVMSDAATTGPDNENLVRKVVLTHTDVDYDTETLPSSAFDIFSTTREQIGSK